MNISTFMDEDHARTLYITFFLAVIINCSNGLFVIVYFRDPQFRTDARYILYIHLVINDILMLNFTVALQLIAYAVNITFAPCCFLLLLLVTTNRNSPLNLACMALERYVAVCRPLHHTQLCTAQRAHILIALIWVISLIQPVSDIIVSVSSQPFEFLSGYVVCYPDFVHKTPYHKIQSVVVQVLLWVFILLTLVTTYVKVVFAARAASGSHQASARNARNTILLHSVQLLISTLSYISPVISTLLLSTWPKDHNTILFVSFLFTNVLPRLLSPLIYGVRDTKFRNQIRLLLHCPHCFAAHTKKNVVQVRKRSKQVLH
uniref:Si:dkeyp-3f10.16 n=1 Tax=Cynoglossus semilaevis TaxID=244447 RepID=A0A3P8WX02_CYNSE